MSASYEPAAEGPGTGQGASARRRVVLSTYIGTVIEWYDFYLYGAAAALVFNVVFFPQFSALAGTLAAFATLGAGFLARPLGGVIWGHFGDRLGRKGMLVASIVIMGVATTIVGLLPTYAQIGIWAPILLVTVRIVQGISAGGEWGGAALMALEHAPSDKRGLWSSVAQLYFPDESRMRACIPQEPPCSGRVLLRVLLFRWRFGHRRGGEHSPGSCHAAARPGKRDGATPLFRAWSAANRRNRTCSSVCRERILIGR